MAPDVATSAIGQPLPVRHYEIELSEQLRVIAISGDVRIFVHEHGDRPGPDGRFRASMSAACRHLPERTG